MVVLVTEVRADGSKRYCNATCHKAKGPVCRCVCGGANHGIGVGAGESERVREPERVEGQAGEQLEIWQR